MCRQHEKQLELNLLMFIRLRLTPYRHSKRFNNFLNIQIGIFISKRDDTSLESFYARSMRLNWFISFLRRHNLPFCERRHSSWTPFWNTACWHFSGGSSFVSFHYKLWRLKSLFDRLVISIDIYHLSLTNQINVPSISFVFPVHRIQFLV